MCVYNSEYNITVGHWPFSNQYASLANQTKYCSAIYASNLYSLLYNYYTILTVDDQRKAPTTTIQALRSFL